MAGGDRPAPAPRCMGSDPGCLHPRVLHAEMHAPKPPWVGFLGSSRQLLFPSVPKPSEKLAENKNVSVKGQTESERSGARVSCGCGGQWALGSVPGWEGHPTPAGCCGQLLP